MNEILIPKRLVLTMLVLVVLIVSGLWAAWQFKDLWQNRFGPAPLATVAVMRSPAQESDLEASQAAVRGAQAFYTLNYLTGQEKWLADLCAVSTESGCAFDRNLVGPGLWDQLAAAQTNTTAQATAQDKVRQQVDPVRANAPMQVWRLQIQLSAPWSVQKTPQTDFSALAIVVNESGLWKFERFVTEEELQLFDQQGAQP